MRLTESMLVTPTLLRRFELEAEMEAGQSQYYAVMLRDNGDLLVHHPFGPSPVPEQTVWANNLLRLLNREMHHDGAWVICFTHPKPPRMETVLHDASKHIDYGRYCVIWVDQDGDPQFTMEWSEGEGDLLDFGHVLLAGIESTAEKAAHAWAMWNVAMCKVLEPKEGQTFKRAQGQRASTARH